MEELASQTSFYMYNWLIDHFYNIHLFIDKTEFVTVVDYLNPLLQTLY